MYRNSENVSELSFQAENESIHEKTLKPILWDDPNVFFDNIDAVEKENEKDPFWILRHKEEHSLPSLSQIQNETLTDSFALDVKQQLAHPTQCNTN